MSITLANALPILTTAALACILLQPKRAWVRWVIGGACALYAILLCVDALRASA